MSFNRVPLPVSLNDGTGTGFSEDNPLPVTALAPSDLTPIKGYTKSVNADSDLATVLGAALPSDISAVTINNVSANTLYIQFDGTAASATSFPLSSNSSMTIYGAKTVLDNVQVFTGSASNIGFLTHN